LVLPGLRRAGLASPGSVERARPLRQWEDGPGLSGSGETGHTRAGRGGRAIPVGPYTLWGTPLSPTRTCPYLPQCAARPVQALRRGAIELSVSGTSTYRKGNVTESTLPSHRGQYGTRAVTRAIHGLYAVSGTRAVRGVQHS